MVDPAMFCSRRMGELIPVLRGHPERTFDAPSEPPAPFHCVLVELPLLLESPGTYVGAMG